MTDQPNTITLHAARANRSGHVFWQFQPDGPWFGELTDDAELAYGGTVEALEVAVGPTRPVHLSIAAPARDAVVELVKEWRRGVAGDPAVDLGEVESAMVAAVDELQSIRDPGAIQAQPGHQLLAGLAEEIARQDRFHPSGYPATRDGLFLGIHTAIHELEREAIEAWRADRCKCETPLCGHARWVKTRGELLQAAAVIMRTIRSIASAAAQAPKETADTDQDRTNGS